MKRTLVALVLVACGAGDAQPQPQVAATVAAPAPAPSPPPPPETTASAAPSATPSATPDVSMLDAGVGFAALTRSNDPNVDTLGGDASGSAHGRHITFVRATPSSTVASRRP
jgi:hypothetical protein